MDAPLQRQRWRRRVHLLVDGGAGDDLAARLLDAAIVTLIAVNIGALVLETVPSLMAPYGPLFHAIERLSVVVFTLEYAIRLWTAPEHARYRHLPAGRARLRYALSPAALLDFLATIPLYAAILGFEDFKILLLFRLLRFFKLGRYSPGMASLGAALVAERKALFACVVILVGVMLVAATAMYFVEHDIQPDKFGTIPDAMWWAIVTLTTVGYGDAFPTSAPGKVVAAITAVMGLVMLALPVGIIATAFSQEIHRREFVVTWSMIARVPLFSGLSAAEIAEVMLFLRAQSVRGGAAILREGEAGRCLYFVAAGEVELGDTDDRLSLDEGRFFGELVVDDLAILALPTKAAVARAKVATKLLVLDHLDFRALMTRHPTLAERIRGLAKA